MKPLRILAGVFTIVTISLVLIFDVIGITVGSKGRYYGEEIIFTILTMLVSLLVYITSILCVFLSSKRKALVFPAMMINIAMALTITITTVQYMAYNSYSLFFCFYLIILLLAAIPAMVFTIIYNAKVRPFAKCCEGGEAKPEPARVSRPASSGNAFEDVRQAKQLLDMGAITQEEFDSIKAKLL